MFIHSEGVYGTVKKMGAFASYVKYIKDGIHYEELMENEDLTFIGE